MSEKFTDVMSHFATGVTVVSAYDAGDDFGDIAMTATSFGPVSFDPPLLFLGVGSDTHMHEVLSQHDSWAATILAAHQRYLAGRFGVSGRPSARHLLDGERFHRGRETSALIIDGGLAGLECRTMQRLDVGDHLFLIAELLEVDYVADGQPLVRFKRRYRAG